MFSEPSGAPQNVGGHSVTSTSILVMWDEVSPELRNGIIISYNVSYQAVVEAGSAGPINSTIVKAPIRQVNLTGLTKDMHYNISVLASTIKGDGIYSHPQTFRTNEDSKFVFYNYATFESKLMRYRFLLMITMFAIINGIGSTYLIKRVSDKVKLTTKSIRRTELFGNYFTSN